MTTPDRSPSPDRPGLLDQMRAITEALPGPGPRCTIWTLLHETLNDTDAAELQTALDDRGIPARAIADVMTAAGHRIGDQTVNRHRAGRCSCGHR